MAVSPSQPGPRAMHQLSYWPIANVVSPAAAPVLNLTLESTVDLSVIQTAAFNYTTTLVHGAPNYYP